MTIPNPDAMNTLPFLANIADTVGMQATNWDAPGIILLKLLAIVFLVLLNGFFVVSEFAIVKVRASQLDARSAFPPIPVDRNASPYLCLSSRFSSIQAARRAAMPCRRRAFARIERTRSPAGTGCERSCDS